MTQELIQKIIDGKWLDTDTGLAINLPIKNITICSGVSNQARQIVEDYGLNQAIICDSNTYHALGKSIEQQLPDAKLIVLESDIHAEQKHIERILDECKNCDSLIAVGSGTINDLCKYSSYKMQIPYLVFATALSMNGYASANASITVNGHKKTLKAQLPQAIIVDLDIITNSPKCMTQAGIGDSICRSTCQADWLLSHLILGTKYKTSPFELLKPYESELLEKSADIVNGDKQAIKLLANTLILSGIGMYLCDGSYPASQGEHMIAHCAQMLGYKTDNLHGHEIAVTSIYMAKLQEKILQNPSSPSIITKNKQDIIAQFGQEIGQQCFNEYQEKLELIQNANFSNWNEISKQIRDLSVNSNVIIKSLKAANCPTTYQELGWSEELFNNAISSAKLTRNRFTFLDLQ